MSYLSVPHNKQLRADEKVTKSGFLWSPSEGPRGYQKSQHFLLEDSSWLIFYFIRILWKFFIFGYNLLSNLLSTCKKLLLADFGIVRVLFTLFFLPIFWILYVCCSCYIFLPCATSCMNNQMWLIFLIQNLFFFSAKKRNKKTPVVKIKVTSILLML